MTELLHTFISSFFDGIIPKSHVKFLTTKKSLAFLQSCFVAPSANAVVNYEFMEQLGDVSANKFLVWYFYERFPFLKCPTGVKIVARLKINYASRASFATLSRKLGFEKFIQASDEDKIHRFEELLEDVFEAFVGGIELVLNDRGQTNGTRAIEAFLKKVFDDVDVSLAYEDLYDAKTRLKEIMDKHPSLGRLKYSEKRGDGFVKSVITLSSTDRRQSPRTEILGTGRGRTKSLAQRAAAEGAIAALKERGFVKKLPPEYREFARASRASP